MRSENRRVALSRTGPPLIEDAWVSADRQLQVGLVVVSPRPLAAAVRSIAISTRPPRRWLCRLGMGYALEDGDALGDGGMRVEQAVEPALVVLEGVVDTHRRRGVVELLEWLVVLGQLV